MTASLLDYFESNPPPTAGKRKADDSPLSDDRNSKEQCMSNTPPSVNEGNSMICLRSPIYHKQNYRDQDDGVPGTSSGGAMATEITVR